ncbi:MAG: hypothetical protein IPN29_14830 [Saprospiraceae bacterium]|nr:hypothetical protein [Saprospiraceae bacterium]
MKIISIIFTIIMLSACVSSKKYKTMETNYFMAKNDLTKAHASLKNCEEEKIQLQANVETWKHKHQLQVVMSENLQGEAILLNDKIKGLQENVDFVKTTNADLTKRIDDLYNTNNVNADIIKKMLEEMEIKNLKVLNLSLALQKQDSLNIHLVKRTKKNISDKKVKKSLEKLGFVFY